MAAEVPGEVIAALQQLLNSIEQEFALETQALADRWRKFMHGDHDDQVPGLAEIRRRYRLGWMSGWGTLGAAFVIGSVRNWPG